MNARRRFQVGDRVTFSDQGRATFTKTRLKSDTGTVVGFS